MTKDARAAFTRAAGIFVFYLTHCSNDFCRDNKRSTIQAADVMEALSELDYDFFKKPVQEYLASKYIFPSMYI